MPAQSRIKGLKDLSRQLRRMGERAGGKALRSATLRGSLPALKAARTRAPVGSPPYEGKDPYPVRTYKGRLRTPGFLRRNIGRKSKIASDKRSVKVMIGPRPEAFYGTQFIELGTSRTPRRPWLEPSFRASIPAISGRMRRILKDLVDKAART